MTPRLECLFDCKHELGEGPIWNPDDGRLWWTDIRGPALHAIEPTTGAHRSWPMSAMLGSFALAREGELLLALGTRLAWFRPEALELETIVDLEPDRPGNRLNDGRCDRHGRFWVGTMQDGGRAATGSLYRFGGDLVPVRARTGIGIPNSLAFSPDGATMYFADTLHGAILAFDYDPASGEPAKERVLATLESAPGRPDGSTVDAEGCLWNARYGGGCVVRYTPDGRVDRLIELPVSQVTCCAFGGPGLETLFITTAAQFLTGEKRRAEPLAGGLFAVPAGVRGLPEGRFDPLPGLP
jgi:sugar lactone lactonase YvrE